MSEKGKFWGLRIKIICTDEAQYKEFLKEMVKLSKCSWTSIRTADDGCLEGFCNFKGSKYYIDRYDI